MRCVYVHSREWYLSFDVEQKRDVIERPIVDEIDCNGWDLRKALHLFTRTNAREYLYEGQVRLKKYFTARTSTGTIVSGPASYGLRLPSI